MTALQKALKAEVVKVRNTAALWLTLVAAILIPLMQFAAYLHTEGAVKLAPGENPWVSFAENSFAMSEVFILPTYVAMLVCLLMHIEHRYQMWKHLFVLPVKKSFHFWAKFLVVIGILFIFFAIFFLFVLGDALFLIHYLKNANPLNASPDWQRIGKLMADSFISVLPILVIHFWLSFRIKNLIVNIGIGFIGVISGLVLAPPGTWSGVVYYPYAFPALLAYRLNPNYSYSDFPVNAVTISYFLVLLYFCYTDFVKNFKGS